MSDEGLRHPEGDRPMSCDEFERRLDLLAGGLLSSEEAETLRRHGEVCPRCGALIKAASGQGEALPDDERDAFVRDVLAATSGSGCGRAEALLPDHADGALEADVSALLRVHVDHCPSCRRLEEELRRFQMELAGLAEIRPDENFVPDVLIRLKSEARRSGTSAGIGRPEPKTWAGWLSRCLARPRFALEVGFSWALLLLVLCGTSSSPFPKMPGRALAMARFNPVQELAGLVSAGSVDPVRDRAVRAVRTFAGTGRTVLRDLDEIQSYAGRIWSAAWRGDFLQAATLLEEMKASLHSGPPGRSTGGKPSQESSGRIAGGEASRDDRGRDKETEPSGRALRLGSVDSLTSHAGKGAGGERRGP